MAKILRRQELVEALRRSGLEAGDVVHVQSNLRSIGPIDAGPDREAMLVWYLAAFQEILGQTGTVTVCTSFEDYGRYGTAFVREESPSRLGVFSEYVRTRPGAVRSKHPIISVAGIGLKAEEICGGEHFDGFGHDSPWGRLHRMNAKFMGLGSKIRDSLTFTHYVEKLYGVPYQYCKLFEAPVYSGGVRLAGPFTMSVRYLDFSIQYDVQRLERRLLESGKALEVPVGRFVIQTTTAEAVVEEGIKSLSEDRYYFLKEPPRFRAGEYPMDGITGPSRTVYNRRSPEGDQRAWRSAAKTSR